MPSRKKKGEKKNILIVKEESSAYRTKLKIDCNRTCDCGPTHINCLTAKEWLKSQLGVWKFTYEKRDVRDKKVHPATFPISLSRKEQMGSNRWGQNRWGQIFQNDKRFNPCKKSRQLTVYNKSGDTIPI
ncbi:MAG: hypothetical protein ACYSR1_05095 [Planctomycetota bacterium]|jgi:hypothetical protein